MNIVIWNCRGALKPDAIRQVHALARRFKPLFIGLLETHVSNDKGYVVHKAFGRRWSIDINLAVGRASSVSGGNP